MENKSIPCRVGRQTNYIYSVPNYLLKLSIKFLSPAALKLNICIGNTKNS